VRGQFSVIGLFIFIAVAIFFLAFTPGIIGMMNTALGSNPDVFTIIAIGLIPVTIFYALLLGYWNSVNSGG
jgi:hypothetical protein